MKHAVLALVSAFWVASSALAADTVISRPSAHSAKATLDRLEKLAESRGLKIFARIDHAAGAKTVGETLRPTELLIFGHPKGGTPLMLCHQGYGLDLPLHVLAWEDAAGRSWVVHRDLAKLGHAHPDVNCDAALKRLAGALDGLVSEALKP